jgi:hypothetical protein
VQEVDQVFCGDVACGARGEWAAARAGDGGVEHRGASLDGGCGVGYSGVARVMEVAGDRYTVGQDALNELSHLAWYSYADGVGQDDLVGARRGHAGGDSEYVLGVDPSFEWVSEGGGERDGDAHSV